MTTQKGFTLVELMVCIAIIGVLAAIAIPSFAQMKYKSMQSEAFVNMRAIAHGAITWYNEEHADTAGNPMRQHFPHTKSPTTEPKFDQSDDWVSPLYWPSGASFLTAIKCADGYPKNAALWQSEPWKTLKFSINKPHYFDYSYKTVHHSNGYDNFTVIATADLDCDGDYGYFYIRGRKIYTDEEITLDFWQAPQYWGNDL